MTIAIPIPRLTPAKETPFCHYCNGNHHEHDACRWPEAPEPEYPDDGTQLDEDV